MSRVKITMVNGWQTKLEQQIKAGLLEAVTDIHRRAVILAPKDTRALANSGKITQVLGGYAVSFGSSRVPYARRRHYENRKNPQTIGYLAKAGDSVARGNMSKYFRIGL